jgi:CubicO group peptidase (beta-lactamase class C family)
MGLSADLEQEIEKTVYKAMQVWNIPGLALAILKEDQVLLAKGYGVRETGKPDKIDEHTLFAIGSNTKAFTAIGIGLLVQDGKITWDDPVTKYIPYFRLYDPNATQLITIRDLLCHRSGLGTWAGDVLLLSNYPAEEIVHRLRNIPPEYGFRAGYGYSNLMFVTAGLVISTVSGMSWDDFIDQRIFKPLGMTDSVTNPRYFGERANIAVPHEDLKARLQTVPYRKDSNVGAAGSICASVSDIARWLQLQLNNGSLDGKQLADISIFEETRSPHTTIKLSPIEKQLFPSRHFSAYGLGWFLNDYHGKLMVRHTGGVDGMLSMLGFVPEENFGIAVFTNKLPNSAYTALYMHIADALLGVPPQDWTQTYIELEKEVKEKQEHAEKTKNNSRSKDTQPSLVLEKYAGDYESLILGGATISLEGCALHIKLQVHESISGTFEHWHYDTFLCKWDDPVLGESLVTFITDGQGCVAEFRLKIREDWIDPLTHVFKIKGSFEQ